MAFVIVMNQIIKPYRAAKAHAAEDVARMRQAWCRSLQLQISLVQTLRPIRTDPERWKKHRSRPVRSYG
jgi:hypothetical protein